MPDLLRREEISQLLLGMKTSATNLVNYASQSFAESIHLRNQKFSPTNRPKLTVMIVYGYRVVMVLPTQSPELVTGDWLKHKFLSSKKAASVREPVLGFECLSSQTYVDFLLSTGDVSFKGVEGVIRIGILCRQPEIENRRARTGLIGQEDLEVLGPLGKGGFSCVYLGKLGVTSP